MSSKSWPKVRRRGYRWQDKNGTDKRTGQPQPMLAVVVVLWFTKYLTLWTMGSFRDVFWPVARADARKE